MNKVVAHFVDGRMIKGVTTDFLAAKDMFHLAPADAAPGARPLDVRVADLKALFFVKDFGGVSGRRRTQDFEKPPVGRKIKVTFKDGEILVGTTQAYQAGRPGFFVVPADTGSNNERCFVVAAATKEVSLL
jgi:hypothetical protein